MEAKVFIPLYIKLAKRFPGRMDDSPEAAADWAKMFSPVPASTLDHVIENLGDFPEIDLKYVPNAYQIKAACKQHAGVMEWAAAMPDEAVPSLDDLRKDMWDLEQKFYTQGQLNHQEWVQLARRFRDADRHNAAEHAMEKYDRLGEQQV